MKLDKLLKKMMQYTGITQLQSSIIFSLILLQLMFAVVLANHCYGFWFPLLSVGCKAYCKCFSVAEKSHFTYYSIIKILCSFDCNFVIKQHRAIGIQSFFGSQQLPH